MSDASVYRLDVIYGEKRLDPVRYWVETEVSGPWFWRTKQHFICSEFMRWGPFHSRSEAEGHLWVLQAHA